MPTGKYIRTLEQIEKLKNSLTGHPVSEITRRRISESNKRRVSFSCTGCGETISMHPCRVYANATHFCTKVCRATYSKNRPKTTPKYKLKNCMVCKNAFALKYSKTQKYCTLSCYMQNRTGAKHPFWREGSTSINSKIRKLNKYKVWRATIYKRDNYICQICHQVGGKLEADHITPLSVIIREKNINSCQIARNCKEIWDTNNGRTLCVDCHRATPTWGYHSMLFN